MVRGEGEIEKATICHVTVDSRCVDYGSLCPPDKISQRSIPASLLCLIERLGVS